VSQIERVSGRLTTVTFSARDRAPSLSARVSDGQGGVRLIWHGQEEITGIAPGVGVAAWGRVFLQGGERTMMNPRYELLGSAP